MAEGYIKLARCLLEKPIFHNPKLLKVWIWCLLKATHKDCIQLVGLQKVALRPGQFVFGRNKAAVELSMPPSTVWRLINVLKQNQSLDIKTNNKYSLITIVNWDFYQVEAFKVDNKVDNKWTTNGQQMDTNKNIKNINNKYIVSKSADADHVPYDEIVTVYNETCPSLPRIRALTDKRKTHIRSLWKTLKGDINAVRTVFAKANASDFLSGRSGKWTSCNFDWLINVNNALKVLEGTYNNRASPKHVVGEDLPLE